ncbi:UNVERIFIED_CONTAM: hypothetical protein K2H54_058175 [Gekko kuhli]
MQLGHHSSLQLPTISNTSGATESADGPVLNTAKLYREIFQQVGALRGAVAMGVDAYMAHGFRCSDRDDYLKELYETSTKYHFLHSLVVLIVPHCQYPMVAGTILSTGMGMFCGAFYYHSLTGDFTFTRVAPCGGSLLILGWIAMAF